MKLLQILYPGLGGTSTVAFSLVDGLKKIKKLKIKNFFIFFGVENLINNNLQNCKKKRINFFFLLKSSFFKDIYKVYLRIKSINSSISWFEYPSFSRCSIKSDSVNLFFKTT